MVAKDQLCITFHVLSNQLSVFHSLVLVGMSYVEVYRSTLFIIC